MKVIKVQAINEDGTNGRHYELCVESSICQESGARLHWSMEKQTKDISLPVIRSDDAAWAAYASEDDCRRVLGEPRK